MRQGGAILAEVLEILMQQVKPGVNQLELAKSAAAELKKRAAQPAFLNHDGFPDVICISVNDEVVHGIPRNRELKAGDLVGLDLGVRYQGMITDAAISLIVGQAKDSEVERLLATTSRSLDDGIKAARAGNYVGDISAAIERRLKSADLGIIKSLTGHGVGNELWEPPEIPNFTSTQKDPQLKAGMTLAIEPMATLGGKEIKTDTDGWTIRTTDGSLAAHFEHTILITDSDPEILTILPVG